MKIFRKRARKNVICDNYQDKFSKHFLSEKMKTIRVDIIHPKAAKLLKDLAELNLIAIHSSPQNGFATVLKKLRSKATAPPSLDEITKEVEFVRAKRYGK